MVSFTIVGLPATQGSMRALHHKSTGRIVMMHDSSAKLRGWRRVVSLAGKAAMIRAGRHPIQGSCELHVSFYLPRPKTVRRALPDRKPDLSKLVRALEDGLSNIAFCDDARIVKIVASKSYGSPPRAEVEVQEL